MAKAAEAQTGRITEEQAGEALHQLIAEARGETESAPAPVEAEQPEAAETPAPETAPEVTEEPVAAVAEPGQDDIESLRKRLADAEEKAQAVEKAALARAEAIKQRYSQNESILRDRYLRKASVADRALKLLKQARTEQGVPEQEVERVVHEIEGTMNPASQSYSAPQPAPPANAEDQALILNSFLNEKGMGADEAQKFGDWMRTDAATTLSPMEQALAQRDVDGFLRLAHTRYQEGLRNKDAAQTKADVVGAVRAVQRTQRDAARAASAAPAAPRKQTASPRTEVDYKKLSKDDLSSLIRKSVEWAKQQ